jgi:PAS domain S-box-containing protein
LVAAAYYAGGVIGLALEQSPSTIAVVWPPNAILLAAFLLAPVRLWPWYLLASLPAHLHVTVTFGLPVPMLIMFNQYLANAAQALLAAFFLKQTSQVPPRFNDLRSTSLFILLAAVLAPALASALSAYLHTLTGWVTDYWLAWRQRLLNNVVATLTFTPLIVLLFTYDVPSLRRLRPRRWLELGAMMVVVVGVAFLVFSRPVGDAIVPALLYALLPVLLWAAARFKPIGLFACLLGVALVSLSSAYFGKVSLVSQSPTDAVLALQLFLIAISVPLILLSALMQERVRTERALRKSQERYSLATAAGSVSVWDWNLVTGEFYLDPALKAALGFQDHEIENTLSGWTRHLHPEDSDRVSSLATSHIAGESPVFEAEHRAIHKDGSTRWLLCRGVVAEYADGVAVRITGTSTDITERKQAEQELQRSSERVRELAGRLISAQEEERRRIARDLHDDLNQKVAALAIRLSNVKQQLPATESRLIDEVDQLQVSTIALVNDIRALSHEIHPAILEQAGLVPALTSLAAELMRLEAFDLQLILPDTPDPIPREIAVGIYRITQESIRNVLRHAGTRRATLELAIEDDVVTLVIRDHGRGFNTVRDRENVGLGLISIKERVHLLNGRLEVKSRVGRGTRLCVRVPLPEPALSMAAH